MAFAVAVVAAVASVYSAVKAARSAEHARRSADGIDRRRHLVEAHDYQERTFRDAHVGLMVAMDSVDRQNLEAVIARLDGRLEVFCVHPWTTDDMASLARREVLA